MSTPKFDLFPAYCCPGDTRHVTVGDVCITARIEYDSDSRPSDSDCYTAEQIEAWEKDEWHYAAVVLSVGVGDVELLSHAASLWGIEINFPGVEGNEHITDCANELLSEALDAARKAIAELSTSLEKAKEDLKL